MHDFFNQDGQATPHFYVSKTGDVEQYIDTDYRATACLDGNDDCIAIESWDGGPGAFEHGSPEWTDAQVESLARLLVWVCEKHGIPLVELPSSRPGTTGVGWHRQGIDGNFPQPPGRLLGGRVTGGERWSESAGKVCPGDNKIRGVVDKILPRAVEILNGDDDMQLTDKVNKGGDTVGDALRAVLAMRTGLNKQLSSLRKSVADTRKKVAELPDGATPADVKRIVSDALENLDATIQLVVNDGEDTAA